MEQCDNNLLNKATTPIRQIYLENGYQDNRNRFNNRYQENDWYDNQNYSKRRPNNDWNEYKRNDSNDSSREEDLQYDYRQNRDQDWIFHHLGITVVNNIKEVVIRINKINQTTKNSISQEHRDNFNMILREKTQISMTINVHNMNRVKPVVHPFLIAIFAGKMDIMQINVRLKPREKNLQSIWWYRKWGKKKITQYWNNIQSTLWSSHQINWIRVGKPGQPKPQNLNF